MKDYQKDTIGTYNHFAELYSEKRKALLLLDEINKFRGLLRGKKILDIGCGPGRDAELFIKRGLDVTGIDLSESFISIASKNVPGARFIAMDVLELDFPDSSFDGVWSCASLIHLKKDDLPVALRKIHSVLKDEGILFVSLKEGEGEKRVLEPEFGGRPRFFSYYSKEDVKKLFESCDFHIIETYLSNEKKRFGNEHRDTDFIVVFAKK